MDPDAPSALWEYFYHEVLPRADELDRRFPDARVSSFEVELEGSSHAGEIGRLLEYTDFRFRWALAVTRELSRYERAVDTKIFTTFPVRDGDAWLEIIDAQTGSFIARLKAAGDLAVNVAKSPGMAVVACFVMLTGLHPIPLEGIFEHPDHTCEGLHFSQPDEDAIRQAQALIRDAPGPFVIRLKITSDCGTFTFEGSRLDRGQVNNESFYWPRVEEILSGS
ncbi:hypothetical protein ACIRG4_32940 [Streptomyces sp. NPDC102395]|uniref:hypothetical protein n=1 Tax=Streptomyces sp. NPDC102395 TaxID=3366168 RepID=UPI0038001245